MTSDKSDRISQQYRRFAEQECRGESDLYDRLSLAVVDDLEIIQFLAQMPVTQPNLFFAAVQFLTGTDRMPTSGRKLRQLVLDRSEELATLMQTRRCQTNEVARCSLLLPALPPGPLALLEVGASAGLNLLLDQFYYDYGDQQVGEESSPVRLRCEVTGVLPRLKEMPKIVWRHGIDLSPVNLNRGDDVQWLASCVWADQMERHARLEAAITLGRAKGTPVQQGNLVTDLPALIANVPTEATLVVFHAGVLPYVSLEGRTTFAQSLADASRGRKIVWISIEAATVVPEISLLAPSMVSPQFLVGRTTLAEGNRRDELMAIGHPHGASMNWLSHTTFPEG